MSLLTEDQNLDEIKRDIIHSLSRAGHDHKSAFRFITLCTEGKDAPNARYVVLREFHSTLPTVFIYTDYRSEKIAEIQQQPRVTILAYDNQKRAQLKLFGEASIHFSDVVARAHWGQLSGGKEAYQTHLAPGTYVSSVEEAHKMEEQADDKHFAVIAIKIKELEVLQLNRTGHIRAVFNLENSQQSFLVP
jgi:pyridoxamine 5'-phosphate oxidase